jgi:hypothetical protein
VKSLNMVALAAVAVLALAACGSSATPAPAAGTSATPGAAASAPASLGEASTPASVPASAGATASTPAGGAVDLCSLLTPADLKAATGKTYEAGVLDSVGQCYWNVGKSAVNSGDLIGASIQDQQLSLIKSTFPGGVDVTVNGKAAYYNGAQGLGSLWVDIGGRLFILTFPRSGALTADDQTAMQKLAEIAVAKIK